MSNSNVAVHVKVLGGIFAVTHALGVVGAAVWLVLAGLIATAGSTAGGAHGDPSLAGAGLIIGGIIGIFPLIFLLSALAGLLSGIGLLQIKPWSRRLCIILSILELIVFPVGTALGVYGLIVMFNEETVAMFNANRIY